MWLWLWGVCIFVCIHSHARWLVTFIWVKKRWFCMNEEDTTSNDKIVIVFFFYWLVSVRVVFGGFWNKNRYFKKKKVQTNRREASVKHDTSVSVDMVCVSTSYVRGNNWQLHDTSKINGNQNKCFALTICFEFIEGEGGIYCVCVYLILLRVCCG